MTIVFYVCWTPRFRGRRPFRRTQPLFLLPEIALDPLKPFGVLVLLRFQGSALIQMLGNQRILFLPIPKQRVVGFQRVTVPDLSMFPAPPVPIHGGDICIPLIEIPRCSHKRQDLHPLLAVDPVSRAVAQCFTIASNRSLPSSAHHAS